MDVCCTLRQLISTGEFPGVPSCSTEGDIETAFGRCEYSAQKKSVKTLSYPWADFLFEHGRLHQITVKITDELQAATAKELLWQYPRETADEIPPFFRCEKILCAPISGDGPEVLANVCPENGDTLVSVAIVFHTEKTMPLTIEIPQDVYTALKELSLSTRRSMEEICGDIIKEQLLSDNDNNHV